MFTGIIETLGKVVAVENKARNCEFTIESDITPQLKVDQSVAHNGVCLTVTDILGNCYKIVAIDETLKRSNLKNLKVGEMVNLERCMLANSRFDGHIVQGHVDSIAECIDVADEDGSKIFTFKLKEKTKLIVEKGSITINGVSLTVVEEKGATFKVAVIPYTFEHTTFADMASGSIVNIEFDIIGKYVQKMIGI